MKNDIFKPATSKEVEERQKVWQEKYSRLSSQNLVQAWLPYIRFVRNYMARNGHVLTVESEWK